MVRILWKLALALLQCTVPVTSFSFAETSRRQQWKLHSMEVNHQSSEMSEEQVQQQNFRFSGVGRLYTTTYNNDDESLEMEPHLQVVQRLASSTVLIVGLGGVGSWAAEALCRSGVGHLILVDLDDICISNTNRQMHAMSSTVGKFKIDEMARRFKDINPDVDIQLIHDFVSNDNIDEIITSIPNLNACLDAIDGTNGKAALIAACARYQIPIVTCGGSAGRMDPCAVTVKDLSRANGDLLLAACRKSLRKLYGFEAGKPFRSSGKVNKPPRKWNIPAVVSTEMQKSLPQGNHASSLRRCDGALGTACFVTGTSGFVAAGQLVSMIANDQFIIPRKFKGNLPLTKT